MNHPISEGGVLAAVFRKLKWNSTREKGVYLFMTSSTSGRSAGTSLACAFIHVLSLPALLSVYLPAYSLP
jgi:hypothetical protein